MASLCQVALLLLLVDREAAVQVDQEIDPCEKLYFQIKEKGKLTEKKVGRGLGCKGPESNRKEENVELGNEVSNLTFITLIT